MLTRDQRRAREFVLWGATLRAARLGTDWCSFLSEHCPVVHNVCGSHAGGRPGAWRLGERTGSRRLNQTLSGLHSTLKCGRPCRRPERGPPLSRRRARAWPRTCARRPRPAPPRGSSSPRQSVVTSPWLRPTARRGAHRRPSRPRPGARRAAPARCRRPRRSRRTRRRRGGRSGRSRGRPCCSAPATATSTSSPRSCP